MFDRQLRLVSVSSSSTILTESMNTNIGFSCVILVTRVKKKKNKITLFLCIMEVPQLSTTQHRVTVSQTSVQVLTVSHAGLSGLCGA